MLTFNIFHPVPAQTEHLLNCCKEPVVPDPLSKVKTTDFAYETCTSLQVQLCAPGKVNKTVKLRLQCRGFAYSYRSG